MIHCEVCGNDTNDRLIVIKDGKWHSFDSFECAIQLLAPVCFHCGCRIIGHLVERHGRTYCCENCAIKNGAVAQHSPYSQDPELPHVRYSEYPPTTVDLG